MSNARSPREVCSTTIGTRGLIGAKTLSRASSSALRSPQLLPRRRPLRLDRLCALDHEVHRLAHGDVLAERLLGALRACALERALQLLVARVRGRGGPQRLLDLLVRDLDPLGLDDRREDGLPLQR